MQRALKIGRRWLYIVHRWIGIGACLLFVVWFASGLIMLYVPYPSLTERERVAGAEPIAWSKVHVEPQTALAAAGLSRFPRRFGLEMLDGEPVYRVRALGRLTISAVDGRQIDAVGRDQALRIARRFGGWSGPARIEPIERDQWTVAGGYDDHRPLWRVPFDDPAGRTLYVSSNTGEVVLDTSRAERVWNWLGTVPHWIYFTQLRKDQPLWRQVILWTSGFGIVSAITGLWIGILRLRLKRRYHDERVSPYRGWMKWHHIGGLVTGVTLSTWIVSGWLSVNPFGLFERSSAQAPALGRYAGQTQARFPPMFARARLRGDVREVGFAWVAGRPLAVLTDGADRKALLDGATGAPARLSPDLLFENARQLLPGSHLARREVLAREDLYWYAHHAEPHLPVLRARFDDPERTWVHIDPLTGEVLNVLTTSDRTERWAFNFLHDFDLPVLLHTRPTWDLLVWALSSGGLIISVSSVVIGWRRLKRKGREVEGWRTRMRRRRAAPA